MPRGDRQRSEGRDARVEGEGEGGDVGICNKYETVAVIGTGSSGAVVYAVAKLAGAGSDGRRLAATDAMGPPPSSSAAAAAAAPRWYACKVYDFFGNGVPDAKAALRRKQMAANELRVLRDMKHPSLVELHEAFETPSGCALVLSLMSGGSLDLVLADRGAGGRLREDEARDVAECVLRGLSHLHSKGVAHRDVKLENILLEDARSMSTARLSDLGMSKQLEEEPLGLAHDNPPDNHGEGGESTRRRRHSICGTPLYAAPEVLTPVRTAEEDGPHQQRCALSSYGLKADVWSCGVVLYILLSGESPFPLDRGVPTVMQYIRRGQYSCRGPAWADISRPAVDLVQKLMAVDAGERLSAAEALHHPWLMADYAY